MNEVDVLDILDRLHIEVNEIRNHLTNDVHGRMNKIEDLILDMKLKVDKLIDESLKSTFASDED